MKNFIRLFCASCLLPLFLAAEPVAVNLQTELSMHSRWDIEGKPVVLQVRQTQDADLSFEKEKKWKFPVAFSFTLRDATVAVEGEGKKLFHDLKNPGPVLSLTEMRSYAGKPFQVTLLEGDPSFKFEEGFGARFKDLSALDDPFFETLFVQILQDLFAILQKNLKAGEGFETVREKRGAVAFAAKTTYTVSENNKDKMVVETAFNIERQKVMLPGQNGASIPAVIYGQLKGGFNIDKQNPLLFRFEDKGVIFYAIGFEDSQAEIRHDIERKAISKPLP